MFKKTSDRLTYLERVASHSTKERANGRIDMIPPDAEQPVDYFNTLHDQYKLLLRSLHSLTTEAAVLSARLKENMKYEAYCQAREQRDVIGHQILHLQEQLSELRKLIKSTRNDAASAIKWHMAKQLLRVEDIQNINNQCNALIGEIMPISDALKAKSTGEREGHSHANRAAANKRQLHRRKSRQYLEIAKKKDVVMYADGEYRQDDTPKKYSIPIVETKKLRQLADHFNKRR